MTFDVISYWWWLVIDIELIILLAQRKCIYVIYKSYLMHNEK